MDMLKISIDEEEVTNNHTITTDALDGEFPEKNYPSSNKNGCCLIS